MVVFILQLNGFVYYEQSDIISLNIYDIGSV